MIKSMTGYGRYKETVDGYDISFEMKSVNHRYFDLNLKLSRYYNFLEEAITGKLKEYIIRGKIEAYLFIKKIGEDEKKITLNEPLCENYYNVLTDLKNKFNFNDDITISSLARFSDIFETEYTEADEETLGKIVLSVIEKAVKDFVSMREREGARIKEDLLNRLSEVEALANEVEKRAPEIVEAYRARLTAKMNEILENCDEQRILQEAAIYADKITTSEETVRLKSHIKEFESLLNSSGAVGKKLDFIVQEMNRESNTIGSKCNDAETSKMVVELKSQIENIREQIQNIE